MTNINNKSVKHNEEFKHSSVKLALESHQAISQTAKNLGLKENTLYSWVTKYRHLFEKSSVSMTSSEELKRLQRENNRLRQERDILKKAAAYFASELK